MSNLPVAIFNKSELAVEGFDEERGLRFGEEFDLLPDALKREVAALLLDDEEEVGTALVVTVLACVLAVNAGLYIDNLFQTPLQRVTWLNRC